MLVCTCTMDVCTYICINYDNYYWAKYLSYVNFVAAYVLVRRTEKSPLPQSRCIYSVLCIFISLKNTNNSNSSSRHENLTIISFYSPISYISSPNLFILPFLLFFPPPTKSAQFRPSNQLSPTTSPSPKPFRLLR